MRFRFLFLASLWLLAPGVRAAAPAPLTAARFAAAILAETNRVRHENGRPALKPADELNAAADDQALVMSLTLHAAHTSPLPGEHDSADRVRRHGFDPARVAENIAAVEAWRQDQAHSVDSIARTLVEAWMNSPGHRSNLLSRDVTYFGASARLVKLPGDVWLAYGVQVFATRRTPAILNSW